MSIFKIKYTETNETNENKILFIKLMITIDYYFLKIQCRYLKAFSVHN